MATDNLLNVQGACERMAISRSKLYELMQSGELPYVQIGRCRRIHPADIEKLIERSRKGGEFIHVPSAKI